MTTRYVLRVWILMGIMCVGSAQAIDENFAEERRAEEIESSLREFAVTPGKTLNTIPEKFDPQTGLPLNQPLRSHPGPGETEKYLRRWHRGLLPAIMNEEPLLWHTLRGDPDRWFPEKPAAAAVRFAGGDSGRSPVVTLEEMEKAHLKKAQLKESPWSDYYWPLFQGTLGNRYADPGFDGVHPREYKAYRAYVEQPERVFPEFIRHQHEASSTDLLSLSPSEKYDWLVGDEKAQLTADSWEQGRRYADREGHVEEWMGICHGWAPAAFMESRPQKSVQAVAADGQTQLTFFPTDIKALASLLWAQNSVPTRFLGKRCHEKNPKRDDNGRILAPECFDTDPGLWHLAIVNRLGVQGRSFVMDNTYDYEVWNQPVYSYRYSYFNPQTKKTVSSLKEAKVRPQDFPEDIFRPYRSTTADGFAYLVGVAMDVVYVAETYPEHNDSDDSDRDYRVGVRYMYDLEITEDGEILGGEWYSNAHPDFLWTPYDNQYVETGWDSALSEASSWTGKDPLPTDWQEAARGRGLLGRGASAGGTPLAGIVRRLIALSHE